MITALSNARTVSISEHMAEIYHAALEVALATLEPSGKPPPPEMVTASVGVLRELQRGFAPVPTGATAEPVQVRPRTPETAAARRAALDPLEERKRLVLGDLYRLELGAGGWWIVDARSPVEIMGPHATRERALDAFSDHQSRPAE